MRSAVNQAQTLDISQALNIDGVSVANGSRRRETSDQSEAVIIKRGLTNIKFCTNLSLSLQSWLGPFCLLAVCLDTQHRLKEADLKSAISWRLARSDATQCLEVV